MTPISKKRLIRALTLVAAVAIAATIVILMVRNQWPGQVAGRAAGTLQVNRTLPAFKPARARFQVSVRPTKEEIFRAHAFEEPLIPIGGEPDLAENAVLAAALASYAKRQGSDDFSSLTTFLEKHPQSAWAASILTNLGFEYYNTSHYSRALDAWTRAWALTQRATAPLAKALADRVGGELAILLAKLGRMAELESFFASVGDRVFLGPATERIAGARAGLSQMIARPEVSFRCGPLALNRILLATAPKLAAEPKVFDAIFRSASTQAGFSLSALRELSESVGMKYQMAFRQSGDFVIPAVIHWKVGHYAAVVRRDGDRYLIQDPTFRNDVWATRAALESEASGYFLVPPGPLSVGWRTVGDVEGDAVFGKGITDDNCGDECQDPCEPQSSGDQCCGDPNCGGGGTPCPGMTTAKVHLNTVNLHLQDHPLEYSPPLGPAVRFSVYYNQRDSIQPAIFTYSNLGPKWTSYWTSYVLDNPQSPAADVKVFAMGGGIDLFTGFDPETQAFGGQKYSQAELVRSSLDSYELTRPDGSKLVFGQPDWAIGTLRKVFLTQVVDPSGNALSFSYDDHLRLVAVTDAIGQVTVLAYEAASDAYKITKVTDPFGRSATFAYDAQGRLLRITDIAGLTSEFGYEGTGHFVNALTTPYGTTSFTRGENGTTRWIESNFPDGNGERIEFNHNVPLFSSDPPNTVPVGMLTRNQYLQYRNTYYWDKLGFAEGRGDYSKAKVYHWLHSSDFVSAIGILESIKAPLEGRVWYDYVGQSSPEVEGSTNQPAHIGRVLDDGTTQLHTYEYNAFGHVTKSIDAVGRTLSYVYADNGVDLLEVRQTRGGNNELLSRIRYDEAHRPLAVIDAAGQTTNFTYNNRGQVLTMTDPRGGVTTNHYDTDGYLTSVDGPLPGTSDTTTATYDPYGRVRTTTDESGYTLTFDYDTFDRLTKTTYPDATFDQRTFTLLDLTQLRDRAGRLTTFEYNPSRQRTKTIDPLGRVLQFEPCACGATKSLTDAMGRSTKWDYDIQGRTRQKTYPDGTSTSFLYESRTSRLRERMDAKGQKTLFEYNTDDTQRRISYPNALVPTPSVAFIYDQDYPRPVQMTDGIGTTQYSYNPVSGIPRLGAGKLARVDGPLPNASIAYQYDELGAVRSYDVSGDFRSAERDLAGRIVGETNALGEFTYAYDGSSFRRATETFPNGQTVSYGYGTAEQDFDLRRIANQINGAPLSEFTYNRDVAAQRITSWTQSASGQPSETYTFGYDNVNELTSSTRAISGQPNQATSYTYDAAGNRLTEQVNGSGSSYSYNALNQLTEIGGSTPPAMTYRFDAQDRLVEATAGATTVKFEYDGLSRVTRVLVSNSGSTISDRRYVWNGDEIAAETDATGVVTKRFFDQGMRLDAGVTAGSYYYTRDHLRSIRELVDGSGVTRARYAYTPFGTRTKLTGDVDAEFGFTGLFHQKELGLPIARYRTYDPATARWLSRDPLGELAGARDYDAFVGSWISGEPTTFDGGPNLFVYVGNDPANFVDPSGRFAGAAAAAAGAYAAGAALGALCLLNPVCRDAIGDAIKDICEPKRPKPNLSRCLDACAQGSAGRYEFCRSIRDPVKQARCWAVAEASEQECRNHCYSNYGN